jgi:hypothetical protein
MKKTLIAAAALAVLTVSANAGATADFKKGFITAFRDHLKTCSRLPADVNVADNVRVVLRIFLKPDGTLAAPPQPIRIEGLLRGGGGDLYLNIVAGLHKCQPYNMLPPNKYDEWKVFDILFTPQNFLRRGRDRPKPQGRPKVDEAKQAAILSSLKNGVGIKRTAATLGCGIATVSKVKNEAGLAAR